MSNLIADASSIAQGTLYQTDGVTSIALSAIGPSDTVIYNGLASDLLIQNMVVAQQSLTNLASALGKRALLLRHGDDPALPAMDAVVFSSLVSNLKPAMNFRIDPLAKLQLVVAANNTQTLEQLVSLARAAQSYGFDAVNVSASHALATSVDALVQMHNAGMRLLLSLDGNAGVPATAPLYDELVATTSQGAVQAASLAGTGTKFMLRVAGNDALVFAAALPSTSFAVERNVLISLHAGDENLIVGYSQFLRDAIAQVQLLVDANPQSGVLDFSPFDCAKVADLAGSTSGPVKVLVDVNQLPYAGVRLQVQDMGQLHLMQALVAPYLGAALYVDGALGQKLSLLNLQWAGEAGISRIEVNGTLQLDIPNGFSGSAVPEALQQIKLLSSHGGGVLSVQMAPADGILPTLNAASAIKLAGAQLLFKDAGGIALRITDSADALHTLLKSNNAAQTLKQLVAVGYQKIAVSGVHASFSISEAVAIGQAGLQFAIDRVAEVRSAELGSLSASDAAALVSAGVDLLAPAIVNGKPVPVVMNWDAYSTLAAGGVYFAEGGALKVLIRQEDLQALAPANLLQTLQLMSGGGADILDAATVTGVQLNSTTLEVMSSWNLQFGKNIAPTLLLTTAEFSAARLDPNGLTALRGQMDAVHASAFKLDASSSTVLNSSDMLALFSLSGNATAPHARLADSSANMVQLLSSWDKVLSTGLDVIEVNAGRLRLSVALAEKAIEAGTLLEGAYDITGSIKQIAAYLSHQDLPSDLTFHANAKVADLKAVAASAATLHMSGVEINLSDTGVALSNLTSTAWEKYASLGVHNVHAQDAVKLTLEAVHGIEQGHIVFDAASDVSLRLKAGETLGNGEPLLLHDAGVDRWIDSHGLSHDLFLV